eukprot:scaffold25772_cov136-Isochrysis_galbana.AAC.3
MPPLRRPKANSGRVHHPRVGLPPEGPLERIGSRAGRHSARLGPWEPLGRREGRGHGGWSARVHLRA